MSQPNDKSPATRKSSLMSLIPTQYIVIGSVVLVGLLNMYKGLFRFSFGFMAGAGIGAVLGFVFADSPVGQYILQQRSKRRQT